MKLDRQAPSITPGNEAAPKAVLVLEDGTVLRGRGLGAFGQALGEVCFNTSMTGYQEILTDPSYAGQIITFTFPHLRGKRANRLRARAADLLGPGNPDGPLRTRVSPERAATAR